MLIRTRLCRSRSRGSLIDRADWTRLRSYRIYVPPVKSDIMKQKLLRFVVAFHMKAEGAEPRLTDIDFNISKGKLYSSEGKKKECSHARISKLGRIILMLATKSNLKVFTL